MVLTRRDSAIAETSGVGANVLAQPPGNSGSGAGAANREAGAAMTSGPTSDRRSDSKFVEFIDVEKMYGDFQAVRRLNLSIGRGEFLTFLGPSGSGKTTTLNMLAGFERPSQGVISSPASRSIGFRPTSAISAWCSRTTRCSLI